jgi:NAD(P)-dependent dehydrogenase (short-subunit alcohol dehydrogenase family)
MPHRQAPAMSGRLAGKVAVVTGAARGIGRAGAVAMAREGADIVGIDASGPISATLDVTPASPIDLEETGRLVRETGQEWLPITLDQRNLAALRDAAELVRGELGGMDILFANAGIQAFCPLLNMQDADWHDQIDVNLTGTANVLRAFAPLLVARGAGRIILTSSTQGRHGTKNGSAYSATKWGILGLMKSAALELGAHKITVNALIPGLIDTPLTRHEQRYAAALMEAGKTPSGREAEDEARAAEGQVAKTPLGVPWISPEDIAPAVVFLASDDARMISGATLDVTGGDSAHYQ